MNSTDPYAPEQLHCAEQAGYAAASTVCLASAVATGRLLQDVRSCPVTVSGEAFTATYRGVGLCRCGQLVPIHVVVRRQGEPAIVHASVNGEQCPGCELPLASEWVKYLGISGPGWPAVPATVFSVWDVCLISRRPN